jgi:type III secretion translocon protein HrpF
MRAASLPPPANPHVQGQGAPDKSASASEARAGASPGSGAAMSPRVKQLCQDLLMSLLQQLVKESQNFGKGQGESQGLTAAQPQAPSAAAQGAGPAPGGAGGAQGQPSREETIATLGRHEDVFKGKPSIEDLQKKASDPNTPPDLKRALDHVLSDPALRDQLDSAKNGKVDGHISNKDINKLQEAPEQKEYALKRSESFTHNYIPSNNRDPNAKGREITDEDAKRELYRYADNLPKKMNRAELQKIADGSAAQGKAPPQLQAAAKHYLDNPDKYERDIGPKDGNVSRDEMLDKFASSTPLTKEENETLDSLNKNKDKFFDKGNLSRDRLQDIAKDPKSSAEEKKTAQSLLDNPMLYSMLDNGKKGHGGNAIYKADDQKIGKGDLEAFMAKKSNEVAPSPRASAGSAKGGASEAPDASAQRDMAEGIANQPDIKKGKGGGLQDFGAGLMKGLSKFYEITSKIAEALSVLPIPGFQQLMAGASVTAKAASGGFKVAETAIEGGDVKGAAKKAAIDTAVQGASAMAGAVVPGGGKAVKAGVEGAEQIGKQGAKEGVEQAAKQGAKEGTEQAAKKSVADGAEQGGKTSWKNQPFMGADNVTKGDAAKAGLKGAGDGISSVALGETQSQVMGDHSMGATVRSEGENLKA